MIRKPLSIKLISLLGIICGVGAIGAGVVFIGDTFGQTFLLLGIVVFILSIGLFKLRSLARSIATIFSFFLIAFYSYLIFVYLKSGFHYGWGVGLVTYFPIFVWSLLSIIFCNLPNIKSKFY